MNKQINKSYLFWKRVIDLLLAIIMLIVLSPLLIIISILISLETKSNPVFIQERGLSLSKRRFNIYKIRTLKKNTNTIKVIDNGEAILRKAELNKYIGPIGKFLRKKGLDEIPQLINIIKGDMSFIGVRPLSIEDLEKIKKFHPEIYQERDKLNIQLGLSGLWQISKDNLMTIDNLIEMERIYFKNRSIFYDLKLILKSIGIIFFARHKDSIVHTNIF